MKTITSFKIAGLITACLFAAMPTKADIGAISFKTSAGCRYECVGNNNRV